MRIEECRPEGDRPLGGVIGGSLTRVRLACLYKENKVFLCFLLFEF